ncbi:MAG: hypothetical protein AAF996_02365 [Pseudomonadota bacterium]
MRFLIFGAALIVSSCGGAPESATSAEPAEQTEQSQEQPNRQLAAGHGPNCNRSLTLGEVLERVQQDAHTMPDPMAERRIEARQTRFGDLNQFVNHCYRGTPTGESAESEADIQYWSYALGGAAITIEHALEDSSYGGISYIYPQAEPNTFTYVYITNANFHTQGTIIVNDDQSFTATETVSGHPTITEVRSISRFDETGLISMTSEFLDSGEWQPGPSFTHQVHEGPFPRLRPPMPVTEE